MRIQEGKTVEETETVEVLKAIVSKDTYLDLRAINPQD